jgi:general secretion pathway protein K
VTGPVHQRGSALLHRQRGAALLIALLILALVATAASSMVWHQQRAIEVETAERAQAQAVQLLDGGVDFARLLVRMAGAKVFQTNDNVVKLPDGRRAFQVAEMSVADMLQFDKDSSSGSTRNAFVDFEATDAQGRYNLRRLFGDDGKPVPAEVEGLRRLCDAAGAGTGTADLLVSGLASAWYGSDDSGPVPPQRVEQLVWLGLDNATVQQLLPHLVILPVRTPVNANTATAAALTAAIDQLDRTTAQARLQALADKPVGRFDELKALFEGFTLDETRVTVETRFIDVRARMRIEDRAVEERWLLERPTTAGNTSVQLLRRDRQVLLSPGG